MSAARNLHIVGWTHDRLRNTIRSRPTYNTIFIAVGVCVKIYLWASFPCTLLKFVLHVANNQFSDKFNNGWKQIKMTDLSRFITFYVVNFTLLCILLKFVLYVANNQFSGNFNTSDRLFECALVIMVINFLVCRRDKLLSLFATQTSVVNFGYYLFCLCNVRRQYLLPGILGIYCFLTGVPSLPAIALPKGRICSLPPIYFLSADVTASFWLALTQCWLNVVPSSMTLFQHWTNIVSGYWVAGVPCKNETFSQCCFTAEQWS